MQISAAMVKELRERTGAGMMECKKALTETGGDIDKAIEEMRKRGLAAADKKAGRVAAEGVVAIAVSGDRRAGVLVEVNCETDFVAKDGGFRSFAQAVADKALEAGAGSLEELLATELEPGVTVEERRRELVARIGENITVRHLEWLVAPSSEVFSYSHGGRIGVLVAIEGEREGADVGAIGKDLAMHVAASRPVCLSEEDMPADLLEREREILTAQAAESGKPPEIVERMVAGRMQKFLRENTLLGQPFVKDPDQSVGQYLAARGAHVQGFSRLEVGEGIERKSGNFAEEVMAQVKASQG